MVERVVTLCRELSEAPARHAAVALALGQAAAELERHFAFHLALEEETIAFGRPVLLIHGDSDPLIPPQALPMSATALRALGLSVETHMSAGVGHGIGSGKCLVSSDCVVTRTYPVMISC